jgi:hypothetical protein
METETETEVTHRYRRHHRPTVTATEAIALEAVVFQELEDASHALQAPQAAVRVEVAYLEPQAVQTAVVQVAVAYQASTPAAEPVFREHPDAAPAVDALLEPQDADLLLLVVAPAALAIKAQQDLRVQRETPEMTAKTALMALMGNQAKTEK